MLGAMNLATEDIICSMTSTIYGFTRIRFPDILQVREVPSASDVGVGSRNGLQDINQHTL
jgi:hypothetical protein